MSEPTKSPAKLPSRSAAALAAAVAAASFCSSAHAAVVIQEIYGGGGATPTATYGTDYVELYNAGTAAVDIEGYFIESGTNSAGYLGATSGAVTYIGDSSLLAPGAYFLIEGQAEGTSPGVKPFPTPNQGSSDPTTTPPVFISPYAPLSISRSEGGLDLFDAEGNVLDEVSYGNVTNYVGTGPAADNTNDPVFTGTNALTRTIFSDGTQDGEDYTTENNATDFVDDAPNPQAVPEPATLGLIAAGGAMLVVRRRAR